MSWTWSLRATCRTEGGVEARLDHAGTGDEHLARGVEHGDLAAVGVHERNGALHGINEDVGPCRPGVAIGASFVRNPAAGR